MEVLVNAISAAPRNVKINKENKRNKRTVEKVIKLRYDFLHIQQKKFGKEVVPTELIEELKFKKANKSQNISDKEIKKTDIQEKEIAQNTLELLENNENISGDTKLENTKLEAKNISDTTNIQESLKVEKDVLKEVMEDSTIETSNASDINTQESLEAEQKRSREAKSEDPEPETKISDTATQEQEMCQNTPDFSEEDKTKYQLTLPATSNLVECNLVEWQGISAETIGRSHIRSNLPCQDATLFISQPRPAIFVADGAGSARLSHFGSKAVVEKLCQFITLEEIESRQKNMLDKEQENAQNNYKDYAQDLIEQAIKTLKKLSEQKNCSVNDLKCTLLITVLGKRYLFWLKVGDGHIVSENENKLELVGSFGKGEFANQTTFITENIREEDIDYGFLPSPNITGIAALTDGAAETLVSMDGSRISGAFSKFFAEMRDDRFGQEELIQFLEDEKVWATPKGMDDRGIALLSRLK